MAFDWKEGLGAAFNTTLSMAVAATAAAGAVDQAYSGHPLTASFAAAVCGLSIIGQAVQAATRSSPERTPPPGWYDTFPAHHN